MRRHSPGPPGSSGLCRRRRCGERKVPGTRGPSAAPSPLSVPTRDSPEPTPPSPQRVLSTSAPGSAHQPKQPWSPARLRMPGIRAELGVPAGRGDIQTFLAPCVSPNPASAPRFPPSHSRAFFSWIINVLAATYPRPIRDTDILLPFHRRQVLANVNGAGRIPYFPFQLLPVLSPGLRISALASEGLPSSQPTCWSGPALLTPAAARCPPCALYTCLCARLLAPPRTSEGRSLSLLPSEQCSGHCAQ